MRIIYIPLSDSLNIFKRKGKVWIQSLSGFCFLLYPFSVPWLDLMHSLTLSLSPGLEPVASHPLTMFKGGGSAIWATPNWQIL